MTQPPRTTQVRRAPRRLVSQLAAGALAVGAVLVGAAGTAAAVVPAAPTGLTVNVSGNSTILNWTNAAGAQGVHSYQNGVKKWVGGYPNPPPTTFTYTGLTAGTYTYTVSDYNGSGEGPMSNSVTVTVGGSTAPTVTGVAPASGPTGGGTGVTITGTNFTSVTGVKFGTSAATGVTVNSSTQISATSPAGSGTVDVTVTTSAGTSATSSADLFTYTSGTGAAPRVSSVCLSPNTTCASNASGPTGGGTSVIVSGTGFTGATSVTFGAGNPASFAINSDTKITVSSTPGAPSGVAGVVDVQVTTPNGTSQVQSQDHFTYTANVEVNPTNVIVPADGSMHEGVTVTVTSGGVAQNGVVVSISQSAVGGVTPSGSAGCTTGSNGVCLAITGSSSNTGNSTLTASTTSLGSAQATVVYKAPGTAPTGLRMDVTNGDGAAATLAGGDAFSDGNHYFTESASAHPGQFEDTASESVINATLVNGSTPLTSGYEPYAITWTVHNAGSGALNVAAISNVAEMGYTNTICSLPTQSDPQGSLRCTPSSYDLDDNHHFSNPANPGTNGIGLDNGTMPAACAPPGCARTVGPGGTLSYTTYMIGQNNNALLVLDSPTGAPASATVSAQLASDPYSSTSTVKGSSIGSAATAGFAWLPYNAAASVPSSTMTSHDPIETTDPDSPHDWVVLTVSGVPTLVQFGQTSSQTYTANGASVTEATFESDLASATSASLAVTNYGAANQANALTGTGFGSAPVVTAGATVTYVAGGSAPKADAGVTVTDSGSANLTGATVSITSGFLSGDTLGFTNQNGITGSYNSGTGVLTLTGTASVANYQTALASITFSSTAGDPTNAGADQARTISWQVTDPSTSSNTATSTVDVYAVPAVTMVSPTSGPAGGGTSVTVTGSGFTGATGVKFGTTTATPFTVTNDGHITVTSPSGTAGTTVHITITGPGGTSSTSTSDQFTYASAPVVTAGATVTYVAGGTAVTLDSGITVTDAESSNLTGATVSITSGFLTGDTLNFTNQNGITGSYNSGTGVLTLSGISTVANYQTALASITFSSSAGDPTNAGADRARTISWQVSDALMSSNTATSTVDVYVVPAVTGVSPSTGPAGGGTSVTVTGSGFTGATGLKFGTTAATTFTVNNDGKITVTAPSGTSGTTVHITVTGPGGTSATSPSDQFTYTTSSGTPTVTGISPTTGPIGGGTSVTITGTNFTGATAVNFGTTVVTTFTVNGAGTSITVTSPPGSGTVDVTVTTPGGTSATSAADKFAYSGGAPAAPTNLHATVSGTTVMFTWTNAPGSSGVKYTTNGGPYKWVGGYPNPPPTTLTLTGVAPGTYTYGFADYNAGGILGPAATVTVTVA